MSSLHEQWLQRTAWKERAAYEAASRNGALAIWVGAFVLSTLLYVAVINLVLDLMN